MRLRLQPLGLRSVGLRFYPDLAEARAKPAPPLKRHRKRRRGLLALALLLLISVLVSGCGSSRKAASTTAAEVSWPGGSVSTGNQAQLVEKFNVFLKGRKKAASPTQLALEFVRADRTQTALTTTRAQSSPEGGGPTTVTIVQDRLADDSVRATRYVLRFVPGGGKWRLESAVRTQRCQVGRGHQNFAAGDCL